MAGVGTTPTQVTDPYGRLNTPHNAFKRVEEMAGRTYSGGPYGGDSGTTTRLGQASDAQVNSRVNSDRVNGGTVPRHRQALPAMPTPRLSHDTPDQESRLPLGALPGPVVFSVFLPRPQQGPLSLAIHHSFMHSFIHSRSPRRV